MTPCRKDSFYMMKYLRRKKMRNEFHRFQEKISLDVELCLTRMNICLEIYKFYCSEVFDRLLNFSLHLNCFI